MKLAIICIGDELLKGSTLNTNLAYMGKHLLEIGIQPIYSVEIPDSKKEIISAIETAFQYADWVITSGGLGPTADDVTKEYISARLGFRLEQNGDVAVAIQKYWKTRHGDEEMPSRILNQSLVPEDAEILRNQNGTAPGLIIRTGENHNEFPNKNVIMLPGPPGELEPMFRHSVLPILKKEIKQQIYSKCFYVCGIGESAVEDKMLHTIDRNPGVSVAYCASAQYVKLFVKSFSSEVLGSVIRDVRSIFANELLPDRAESLEEEVLQLLRENEDTLATAESCTGGLISKMITDVPGASDVFQGAVVSYANKIKETILGVNPDTLQKFGAVSPETAKEMVLGLAEKFHVSAAIATTGIAGPDGGTPEKPVGLVYVGIFYQGRCEIFKLLLQRSREQIRERAACEALNRLRLMILGKI